MVAPMTPGEGEVYVLDPFERVTGPAEFAGRSILWPIWTPNRNEASTSPGKSPMRSSSSEGRGAHWTLSARAFLRGLVLYIAKTAPETGTLITVRQLMPQRPPIST